MARFSLRRRPPTASPLDGMVVGDIDGPVAVVDPTGRIGAIDGSWRVEWGAGAEGEWHLAHETVAVRQTRIDDAPVVETAMRIPSGDLRQRVAAVGEAGGALVVEIENDSPTPVALALVGIGAGDAAVLDGVMTWGDGTRLAVDQQLGGAVVDARDPWSAVRAEPTASEAQGRADVDGGAAAIIALPHRQRIEVRVALPGAELPSYVAPATVASGWRAVTRDVATLSLPDPAVEQAWRRVVPDLVVAAGSPDVGTAAEAAWWCDVAGLFDEADRARARVVAEADDARLDGADAVAALRALASRELRVGQRSGLEELVGLLLAGAGSALDASTRSWVAAALAVTDPETSASVAGLSVDGGAEFEPRSRAAQGAAKLVATAAVEAQPGEVALAPDYPSAWRGGELDVRSLVTGAGRLAYSVRWHGERPALLWELDRAEPSPVVITAPGLDADWCSDESSGEALLAPWRER